MNRKMLGSQAEDFVAQRLIAQGYKIIARNYQKRYGEIDIIAQKDDICAFVEVKFRTSRLVPIQASINWHKQQKIALVAREYISLHNITHKICRFDAALVSFDTTGTFSMNYIQDAFRAD